MEWLIVALCALGGGVFRRGIGIGDNLPRFVPILFSVPFAVLAAWPYGDIWVTLVVAAYMILYFIPGHKFGPDLSWKVMPNRYLVSASVVFLVAVAFDTMIYPAGFIAPSLMMVGGGLTLFVVYLLANVVYTNGYKVPTNKYLDGPHSYAEFLGCAAVFGWVSVIWVL
ncbi:MAG: hypothetical protein GOVbin631_29 [Prokaryotic dsDNA virus sp.]|nr:MAG: hypothetical protein GOVbin631_29 [Prokaryotic dsDNA virus sp.]|tara:strand:- start:12177 stop:12680 length:504 start_codon:yes stop_codon:yes gene_type:complete